MKTHTDNTARLGLLLIILYGLTILAFGFHVAGVVERSNDRFEFMYDKTVALEHEIRRLRHTVTVSNRNQIERNTRNTGRNRDLINQTASTKER